jgi:hypothetical protein
MARVFEKHHFNPWRTSRHELTGLGKLVIEKGEEHSECKRCQVKVKVAAGTGSTKFWVGGRWTDKRPVCQETEVK